MCLERVALRWVKKYICNFGGDASKITMLVALPSRFNFLLLPLAMIVGDNLQEQSLPLCSYLLTRQHRESLPCRVHAIRCSRFCRFPLQRPGILMIHPLSRYCNANMGYHQKYYDFLVLPDQLHQRCEHPEVLEERVS